MCKKTEHNSKEFDIDEMEKGSNKKILVSWSSRG